VRANLTTFTGVADWARVVNGPVEPLSDDPDFLAKAAALLPEQLGPESWSAWAFNENGLAPPLWQVDVRDVGGVLLGRADAWWLEGVAGEADGRAKYRTRALSRGTGSLEDIEAVLHEERARETSMRRTGVPVVRWGARDVLSVVRARELAGYIDDQRSSAKAVPFHGSVHLPSLRR